MTYNVFGGTLNIAQSNPIRHLATNQFDRCSLHVMLNFSWFSAFDINTIKYACNGKLLKYTSAKNYQIEPGVTKLLQNFDSHGKGKGKRRFV